MGPVKQERPVQVGQPAPIVAMQSARQRTNDRIADAQGYLGRLERQAEYEKAHLEGLLRELDSFDAAIRTLQEPS